MRAARTVPSFLKLPRILPSASVGVLQRKSRPYGHFILRGLGPQSFGARSHEERPANHPNSTNERIAISVICVIRGSMLRARSILPEFWDEPRISRMVADKEAFYPRNPRFQISPERPFFPMILFFSCFSWFLPSASFRLRRRRAISPPELDSFVLLLLPAFAGARGSCWPKVQRELRARKFYFGEIDGQASDETVGAVQAKFRTPHDIDKTGQLDNETLRATWGSRLAGEEWIGQSRGNATAHGHVAPACSIICRLGKAGSGGRKRRFLQLRS